MKLGKLLRCSEPQFPPVSITLMNAKLTGFLRRSNQNPQETNQQLVVKIILVHVYKQGGASLKMVWAFNGKFFSYTKVTKLRANFLFWLGNRVGEIEQSWWNSLKYKFMHQNGSMTKENIDSTVWILFFQLKGLPCVPSLLWALDHMSF